jgi:hypothetical protein
MPTVEEYRAFLRSKPRGSYANAVISETDNTERYRARFEHWLDNQGSAEPKLTLPRYEQPQGKQGIVERALLMPWALRP